MRARFLIVPSCLTVALALAAPAQQAAPAPRLPAAFYDIEVREQLGFSADDATRASSRATINGSARRLPGAAVPDPQPGVPFRASNGPSRFIIDADSLLYRSGRYFAEIPIESIIRVEEVRRPERNPAAWVKVTYVVRDEEQHLYLRRAGTQHQSQILDALRLAIAENAARRNKATRDG